MWQLDRSLDVQFDSLDRYSYRGQDIRRVIKSTTIKRSLKNFLGHHLFKLWIGFRPLINWKAQFFEVAYGRSCDILGPIGMLDSTMQVLEDREKKVLSKEKSRRALISSLIHVFHWKFNYFPWLFDRHEIQYKVKFLCLIKNLNEMVIQFSWCLKTEESKQWIHAIVPA